MNIAQLKEKIDSYGGRDARTGGSPHGGVDRELSRVGKKRVPDDIPKQDHTNRFGQSEIGNVQGKFHPSTSETNDFYKMGAAARPPIKHDKGFSDFPKRAPELNDYLSLYKWMSMVKSAKVLRPDLVDAVAFYEHFLAASGETFKFSYERYVNSDSSGRCTLRNAVLEAQHAVLALWQRHNEPKSFHFTGPEIPCGSSNKKHINVRRLFPYPATENWQKAIGAHRIWLSGYVEARLPAKGSPKPKFSMHLRLFAEDQYNFNPGATDIATGIPDNENGQLVVCGLAKGFRSEAVLTRSIRWEGVGPGVSTMAVPLQLRQSPPR